MWYVVCVQPQIECDGDLMRTSLVINVAKYTMDEATMQYLVRGRVEYTKPKHPFDPVYKTRILEMTERLMDQPGNGAIRDAFEMYVSECITHFNRQEIKPVEVPVLACDKMLYKKLKLAEPKQKNIKQMYERTHT